METTQQTAQAPDAGLAEKFKVILGKLSAANAAPETIKRIASASNTIGALTDFFTEAVSEVVRVSIIKEDALIEQLRAAEQTILRITHDNQVLRDSLQRKLTEEQAAAPLSVRPPHIVKGGKKGG